MLVLSIVFGLFFSWLISMALLALFLQWAARKLLAFAFPRAPRAWVLKEMKGEAYAAKVPKTPP